MKRLQPSGPEMEHPASAKRSKSDQSAGDKRFAHPLSISPSTFSLSLGLSFMQLLSRECSLLSSIPCDDSSRDKKRHDTL